MFESLQMKFWFAQSLVFHREEKSATTPEGVEKRTGQGVVQMGKVQMGALKWGLKVTLDNSRTIVHICGLLGPFLSGTFVAK